MDEFDLTDLTNQVGRLRVELEQADRLNGRLIRLMKDVLIAWHDDTTCMSLKDCHKLDDAMALLEDAFNEAEARRTTDADPEIA